MEEPLPGVTVQTTLSPLEQKLLAFPATPAHVACIKRQEGGVSRSRDVSLTGF